LPCFIETYYYFIFLVVIPLLWMPVEALLLMLFGTTPGKALLGIKICHRTGAKLSFWQGLKRASGFASSGVIHQVPLTFKRMLAAMVIVLSCSLMSIFGNALTKWTIGFERGISNEGWVQYIHDEGEFKVHFPHDPKEEQKQLEIPNANKVLDYQELQATQNKKVHYSVTYMELPRKWKIAGSSTLLKGALEIMVKYLPETAIVNKQFTTHQTYRALDFHLKQGEDEVEGRLILVGMTLYKLTVIYPPELAETIQETPFFDSFDLSKG